MADHHDAGDRTEEATPKHREEARSRGNFARSGDLSTALVLLSAAAVLVATGPALLDALRGGIVGAIRSLDSGPGTIEAAATVLRREALAALRWVVPFLGAAAVVAAGLHWFQAGGFFIARDALAPQLSRFDPARNLGRIFSVKGAGKVAAALLKAAVIVGVLAWSLSGRLEEIAGYADLAFEQAAPRLGLLVLGLFVRACAVLVILGLADLLFQRWSHGRDLRMTKQQVRDEAKNEEGDPQVRRRQRERQREIATKPLAQAVRDAAVVVTNPTHYAVALEYADGATPAPRVVAKGADDLAQEIRRLAREHEVPVIEQPPLARALFREVKVGDLVPESLYRAVAGVLAIVWRLREQRRKPAAKRAAAGRS